MRVVVPFTRKTKRVLEAIEASGFEYELIDVSESQFRYWYVVKELFDAKETFATVEHDILVNSDTLKSFDDCPCDWDIAPYPYALMPEGFYAGLGCCKITDKLIARNPDAMELDSSWYGWDKNHKPRHWCRVDGYLKDRLLANGERPHAHDVVQHLGDNWPSHGCVPKGKK